MAVLVTRPAPDNERTATALRARGFDVLLAPMLRFEPVALPADIGHDVAAVIVTSSNALRAIAPQLKGSALLGLPLFAVGDQTAAAARDAGFRQVVSAAGDATALRNLIANSAVIDAKATLLYLAGADISRDLASELTARGFDVITQTVYRMAPVAALPRAICEAFAANRIQAVLHYSRRSAAAFVAAIQADGVEISALAVPHGCLSANVAEVLREAGATQVTIAAHPDENDMLEGLARALRT
ncbi:uroporphyrinogen III methyltransferase [Bradyrhizobium sp. SSBR45G]|uniref:uroporphyrinogen-III synthase n=1 Tax=unclassified Bradyrhizobium TaxID=2631580 RepID=UPI002342A4AA|nr:MULTISPECIES: uroporphyrinogen-III synthase [unclassified Bradyrhizobium]GLH76952.1 uroporphyrinogen III methyltransferase [Bradyrhizobium sp. SSBR45G]GLH83710.1 uroporphyrinogen III methyltransferase [Bradyrhizobium sp. SSBR45R]